MNLVVKKENLDLVYLNHHLNDDNKKLKDYDITKPNCIILATFRTRGGLAYWNEEERIRVPDFNNFKELQPTLNADCIMNYNSEDELRVEMPCGHAFSPLTIFQYIKMQSENLMATKIECPVVKCNKEWSFELAAAAADLNSEEFVKYGNIFASRQVNENDLIKSCPHCSALVQRPENLTMLRVKCTQCKGSDFCWSCSKSWQGGGFTVCGNNDCGTKYVNDQLKSCGMCTPSGLKIQVPKMRACPRCLTIITYKEACKHMPCWGCTKKFCFVCLGLQKDDGTWPCNSHNYECPVASIQVLK